MNDMVMYKANINGTDKVQAPVGCIAFTESWRQTATALLGRVSAGPVQTMFLASAGQNTSIFYERNFDQTTQTSSAPSRCLHAQITLTEPRAYKDEHLNSLLGFRFASEKEICDNLLPIADESEDIRDTALHTSVLKAVLCACFSRWKVASLPLTIILSDDLFETNALSIYKAILKSMPYLLRAKSGYCINPPKNAQLPEGICICFLPESRSVECTDNVINLVDQGSFNLAALTLSSEIQEMCSYLASASQEERDSLFRWLAVFVECGPDCFWRSSRSIPDEYAQIYDSWEREGHHSADPQEDEKLIAKSRDAELEQIKSKLNDLPLDDGDKAVSPSAINEIFASEAFLLRYTPESAQLKNRILCDWFTEVCNNDNESEYCRLKEIQAYYEGQGSDVQCMLQPIWMEYLLKFVEFDRQNGFAAYDDVIALKKHLSTDTDFLAYDAEHRYFIEVQQSPTIWFRHIKTGGPYKPSSDWKYKQALQELETFLDANEWDVLDAYEWDAKDDFVIKTFKALRAIRNNTEPEEIESPPAETVATEKQKRKRSGRRADKAE